MQFIYFIIFSNTNILFIYIFKMKAISKFEEKGLNID